jgi:hypothetical protein
MADFNQFLDKLSDEELQLMDSDPEFFNEMKTQFESQSFDPNRPLSDEEYAKLTPKQQMEVIKGEKGSVPSVQDIPGVTAIGDALELSTKGWQQLGEMATEGATKLGAPAPIAAAAGLPISMANEIAGAAAGLKTPIQGLAREIKSGGVTAPLKSLAGETKSLLSKLRGVPKPPVGSSEVISENIRNLPLQQADEASKLEALRKSYGSNIEAARVKAGIPQGPMSKLPVPKDVVEFADEMKIFSQRNADDLVRDFGKEGLADLKDTIQVMRESGKIPYGSRMSAEVNKAATKIDEALAKVSPELEESLQGYRLTKQQAEGLPQYYKERTIEARNQLAKAKASEKSKKGKEFLKKAFKSALPWVGGGAVAKFF